jgi:hypothetical protein
MVGLRGAPCDESCAFAVSADDVAKKMIPTSPADRQRIAALGGFLLDDGRERR